MHSTHTCPYVICKNVDMCACYLGKKNRKKEETPRPQPWGFPKYKGFREKVLYKVGILPEEELKWNSLSRIFFSIFLKQRRVPSSLPQLFQSLRCLRP